MNEAIERIRSMMQTEGYDAVVLKTRANFGERDNEFLTHTGTGLTCRSSIKVASTCARTFSSVLERL